jgi:hypothetical protein
VLDEQHAPVVGQTVPDAGKGGVEIVLVAEIADDHDIPVIGLRK